MISRLFDRIFCLAGALLFAQFPQFFLQYLHQLSGHVSELAFQVHQLELSAKLSNKTLSQLIFKFLQNSDMDIVRQGDLMRSMVERYEAMSHAQTALQHASLFTKPFLFIRHVQAAIAQDTWHQFQLGFSFTIEGVLYALAGMVIGFSLFQMLRTIGKKIIPKRRTQADKPA